VNSHSVVEFAGHQFRPSATNPKYFYASVKLDGKWKKVALHRYIWEMYNKRRVPDDCDIHHIDGDTTNNDPSNLTPILRSKHRGMSWLKRKRVVKICRHCGKRFSSYDRLRSFYCSNHCMQSYYYAQRRHFEDRGCAVCGATFSVRKNEKTRTCSRACAQKVRSLR
jgi:hypothetical protein